MANTSGCYVCADPPVLEVHPRLEAHEWLIPLCRRHAGDGVELLARMFADDPEVGAGCELYLPGEYVVVDEDQGDGQV